MRRVFCLFTMLALGSLLGGECSGAKDALGAEKLLPAEKKSALAEKCAVAGKKYYDEFVRSQESPDFPLGFLRGPQEYYHNSRLNTCLVYISLRTIGLRGERYDPLAFVIDVYSDRVLLNLAGDRMSAEEFSRQKDKLFSE